jgi:hypothetical protein
MVSTQGKIGILSAGGLGVASISKDSYNFHQQNKLAAANNLCLMVFRKRESILNQRHGGFEWCESAHHTHVGTKVPNV